MSASDDKIAELAGRLMPAMIRVMRRMKRDAPPLAMNPIEMMVLFTIRHSGGIGMAELAAREGISSPTMSAHVKRLEQMELVTRTIDPDDRRRAILTLSPKAITMVDSAKRDGRSTMATWLAGLSAADIEALEHAVEPLERLAGDLPHMKECS